MYNPNEDGGCTDPIIDTAHAVGLYPPDQAAAAARTTLTDMGSGQWRKDD